MTDNTAEQRIPEFQNRQEMAEWFEKHDFLDYPAEFKEVSADQVSESPVLSQTHSIRLSDSLFEERRNQAEERGIEATALARMWVIERLKKGARAVAA